MKQKTKIRCGLCHAINVVYVKDLPKKIDTGNPPKILCWKCCKKLNYYTKNKCCDCGDLTVCQGRFLKNGKKGLREIEGV